MQIKLHKPHYCSLLIVAFFIIVSSCSKNSLPVKTEVTDYVMPSVLQNQSSASGLTSVNETIVGSDYYVEENIVGITEAAIPDEISVIPENSIQQQDSILPETINTYKATSYAHDANIALFWGILSLVLFPFGAILGAIGIVKSIKALRQIANEPASYTGEIRARIGLVLSIIGGLAGFIILFFVIAIFLSWLGWINFPLPQA